MWVINRLLEWLIDCFIKWRVDERIAKFSPACPCKPVGSNVSADENRTQNCKNEASEVSSGELPGSTFCTWCFRCSQVLTCLYIGYYWNAKNIQSQDWKLQAGCKPLWCSIGRQCGWNLWVWSLLKWCWRVGPCGLNVYAAIWRWVHFQYFIS